MKQSIGHKKLNPLQGLLLIVCLLAILFLVNYLAIDLFGAWFSRISERAGGLAGLIAFWVIGGFIALQVLRVYVARISYTLTEDLLRMSRFYGKRERHIEDIYLNQLLFVGAPEDARKRYGKLRCTRATHSSCKLERTALVYKNSSGMRMALIQANDELKAALTQRVKRK